MYHTTKYGNKIKISDLETSHLKNIIKMIEKKQLTGLLIQNGCSGFCGEDMYYDEDEIYGDDVKLHLSYDLYFDELNRRGFS